MKKRRRIAFAAATAAAVLGAFAVSAAWAPVVAPGVLAASSTAAIVYVVLYVKDLLAGLAIESQALHQMNHLPLTTAMPWSEYALAPRVVARLLFEIERRDASSIVECGTGVSTVVIARTLKSLGKGHLYSIEHDAGWATFVERMLAANSLRDYATVIVTALHPVLSFGQQSRWYDEAGVTSALADSGPIDVLIVDGPPERSGVLPRLRALPFFAERLAPDALLLVDDLHRAGEQRMMEYWAREYDLQPLDVTYDEGYGFFTVRRNGRS